MVFIGILSLGQQIKRKTVTSEQVSQSAVFCASPSGAEWRTKGSPPCISFMITEQ